MFEYREQSGVERLELLVQQSRVEQDAADRQWMMEGWDGDGGTDSRRKTAGQLSTGWAQAASLLFLLLWWILGWKDQAMLLVCAVSKHCPAVLALLDTFIVWIRLPSFVCGIFILCVFHILSDSLDFCLLQLQILSLKVLFCAWVFYSVSYSKFFVWEFYSVSDSSILCMKILSCIISLLFF